MDWALPAGLAVLFLLACPLMMVGMMVFGWLFMRGRRGGHGGHGMMMCIGHGEPGHETGDTRHEATPGPLIDELKAERQRLNDLIAHAEGNR